MAARTTPTTDPDPTTEATDEVVYDFDNWSDEAETKAIAALEPKIKHIIVEKRFIGQFEDGTIVELPLRLSVDDIDALTANGEGPVDQLKSLLTKIGGEKASADFTRQNMADSMAMAHRFFTIFQRIAGASIPE